MPKELWQDVQIKLKLIRKNSRGQRSKMKAAGGRRNSYILSGILKCASCGRSYTVCDSRRYKYSGASDNLCNNKLAVSRKKIEPLVIQKIQDELLSKDVLVLARNEMRRLLNEDKRRRINVSPKADAQRQLEACEKRIVRIRRAISLTDDDIDELAEDLNIARKEQKELEAKLGTARGYKAPRQIVGRPSATVWLSDRQREAV